MTPNGAPYVLNSRDVLLATRSAGPASCVSIAMSYVSIILSRVSGPIIFVWLGSDSTIMGTLPRPGGAEKDQDAALARSIRRLARTSDVRQGLRKGHSLSTPASYRIGRTEQPDTNPQVGITIGKFSSQLV